MTQCKQCGAALPEEAKFCLQCGTPVPTEPEDLQKPAAPPPAPPPLDFIQPGLAGGMFLGFLSALPFINFGNCLCCMWILMGGGIGAMLLSRQRPLGVTYGDGAFVGVLSGLFGSIVGTVVHIPIQIIMGRLVETPMAQIDSTLDRMGIEGPMKELMRRVLSGELTPTTILITFFSNLLVYSLFAMIGGILAVAILNKRMQAQRNS